MTRTGARRRGALVAVSAVLVAALAACSPTPAASVRPLDDAEAERLAVVRFRNFDAGMRTIDVRIPGTAAGELAVTGWFDFAHHVGYGAVSSDGESLGLVWWDDATIATRETPVGAAPLPAPADGWSAGPLDPDSTTLATVLTLVGSLGADRPENPQLLRQSDAAWLRDDAIDGVEVDVFAGPSSEGEPVGGTLAGDALDERTRYWVDAEGVLHRFEVRLGAATEWTVVDFGDGDGAELPVEVPGG